MDKGIDRVKQLLKRLGTADLPQATETMQEIQAVLSKENKAGWFLVQAIALLVDEVRRLTSGKCKYSLEGLLLSSLLQATSDLILQTPPLEHFKQDFHKFASFIDILVAQNDRHLGLKIELNRLICRLNCSLMLSIANLVIHSQPTVVTNTVSLIAHIIKSKVHCGILSEQNVASFLALSILQVLFGNRGQC